MRVITPNDSKPKTSPEERRLQQPPIQRQPCVWNGPLMTRSETRTNSRYPTALQLKAQARKKLMSPHVNHSNHPIIYDKDKTHGFKWPAKRVPSYTYINGELTINGELIINTEP